MPLQSPADVRQAATVAVGLLWLAASIPAQNADSSTKPSQNPLGRDPSAIEAGDALFHERCAVCHGQRAQGAMASNLVRTRSVRRGTERALFELIQTGIPGTEMPPQPDLADERIWQVVSYLRSLALPGQQPPLPGDPEAGRALFASAGCASCHIVNGSGGFFGPSLDSIAIRKTSEQIRQDVLAPDESLTYGYESVVVETSDGRRVEGLLKNEDNFLVVVQTEGGEIEVFQRTRLRSVETPDRSRMPGDFGERLSAEELGNLLAFLDRQRDPYTPVVRGFGVY